MKYFHLPDLGEGLPEAEIVEWHVQPGDEVHEDQLLVSVETAKAVVEVPSPVSGRVVALFGQPGDVLHTGEPLVEYSLADSEESPRSTPASQRPAKNLLLTNHPQINPPKPQTPAPWSGNWKPLPRPPRRTPSSSELRLPAETPVTGSQHPRSELWHSAWRWI